MYTRSYSSMRQLETFEERYEYLRLSGEVGAATFGYERWMNQQFYRSREWKLVRDEVIARDSGLDLGVPGYEIYDRILVHHINPLDPDQIEHGHSGLLDPDNLITTTHNTHNAIHYGDFRLLVTPPVERHPGDTDLWPRL